MTRKEFLGQLGLGAAFVLTTACFGACKKDAGATPQAADFTIDLSSPSYATLLTNGNYLVINDIVVARTNSGSYVAATVICSHEQRKQVYYSAGSNEFQCSAHGARFSSTGTGLNGNGSNNLRTYNTTLTGTSLRIYS